MKFILSFAFAALLSATSFASSDPVISTPDEKITTVNELTPDARPCTVNIDITHDDGSTTSGTIVISDLNWFQCAAIHIADFFSSEF